MKGLIFLSALGLFTLRLVPAQMEPSIPIPSPEPGLRYNVGNPDAPVVLEAFLELICSDSVWAWAVLKDVAAYYGSDDFALIVHQYPLPYHRNAYLCQQGYNLIYDDRPNQIWDYVEAVFDDYQIFGNTATRNKTEYQVLDDLAVIAEASTGMSQEEFKDRIFNYGSETIGQWKYGARRLVAGTPWYFVNGVDTGINPGYRVSFEDWIEFLDPLFPTAKHSPGSGEMRDVKDTVETSEEQVQPKFSNVAKLLEGAFKH